MVVLVNTMPQKFKVILQIEIPKLLNTSDKSWLSNTALNEMAKEAKGDNFLDLFNCRSNDVKQKLGFRSWDDFFTRTFKEDWTYI